MTEQHQDPLDKLLKRELVSPPDHFAESVIKRLPHTQALAHPTVATSERQSSLWPSLALAASTLLGVSQIIGFIFGLWIPATAG